MKPFIIFRLCFLIFFCVLLCSQSQAQVKSPAQIKWESLVGENRIGDPAFAYVEDTPGLPRVLLIGDSISIGYTPTVRELLAGKANVHRIPTNGANTQVGLENLSAWLGDETWDVIHANWGLHDIKRLREGKMDATAKKAIEPKQYRKNLKALMKRLTESDATVIWAMTTHVPEGAAARIPGDEVRYNEIAGKVMKRMGIQVNDLYEAMDPHLSHFQRKANVHFHPKGSVFLGKQVSDIILKALEK